MQKRDPKRDELPLKAKPSILPRVAARANQPLSAREYVKLYSTKKQQRYAET